MYNFRVKTESYREAIFDDLERLVNTNSFTDHVDGVNAVVDILMEIAARYGIPTEKVSFIRDGQTVNNLLYRSPHPAGYYALVGHCDTVHPPESDFNKLTADGDNLVGPGVNDMKAGLLVALYTVVIIKTMLPLEQLPLRILFNADEETGSTGSRHIIAAELAEAKAGFVFEPGRSNNCIVTRRKGKFSLDVEIHGKPSHAGDAPAAGSNAITAAGKLIARLTELNNQQAGTSVECTMISGGSARNVIPDYCQLVVDIRVADQQSAALLRSGVEQAMTAESGPVRIAYQLEERRPPLVKDERVAELAEKYRQASLRQGFPYGEISSGGVSDANLLSGHGVPCIDGLGAIGQFAHTHKEYIIKESLMDRIAIFTDFFYQLLMEENKQGA